jgi:hypothetical protein
VSEKDAVCVVAGRKNALGRTWKFYDDSIGLFLFESKTWLNKYHWIAWRTVGFSKQ